MNSPLRFSVVIANYNYARYVARAIDSALALDWPAVEVIVVDDGSTDGSAAVIAGYGDRIAAQYQANAGQRAANNAGFAASSGDIVVFLDADDVLEPGMARAVAAAWHPGTSKVQVQIQPVDIDERPIGAAMPRLRARPTPARIRHWARATTEYPTPPGSGNAYARAFLDRIFPLGADRDGFTDTTCIAMAPFLGDVETVTVPMVRYRIHGLNDSNLLADEGNFGREVARAVVRLTAARDACRMRGVAPPHRAALRRGTHLLQLRAASMRLRPAAHPLAGDTRARALSDALALPFRRGFEPLHRRVLIAGYSVLTLLLPLGLARALILRRFART